MISHNLHNGSASNLDRVNRGEGINHDKTDFPTSRAQAIKRAVFLQVFGPYCILQIAPELVKAANSSNICLDSMSQAMSGAAPREL